MVEEGSFRKAAKRLAISPSVISQHIGRLEAKLGIVLFLRSTRQVTLTGDGQLLYRSAQAMLAAAEQGLSLFSETASDRLVEFRIAIPAMLATHPIFDQVAKFALANPGVRLNLHSSDVSQDLIKQNIDAGIRIGRLKDSELKARKIGVDRRVAVAAPSYIQRKSDLSEPKQLNDWDWISFTPVPDFVEFRKPGTSALRVWGNTAATTDSIATLRKLAIAGVGAAGLPFEIVKDDVANGHLVELFPEWAGTQLNIYVIWAREGSSNKHLRTFINTMAGK